MMKRTAGGPVVVRPIQVAFDFLERSVGAEPQRDPSMEVRESDDALGLGVVLRDVTSATRPVDGNPVDVEDASVEQQVGDRVLVVELVVGVGVQQDADAVPGRLAPRSGSPA